MYKIIFCILLSISGFLFGIDNKKNINIVFWDPDNTQLCSYYDKVAQSIGYTTEKIQNIDEVHVSELDCFFCASFDNFYTLWNKHKEIVKDRTVVIYLSLDDCSEQRVHWCEQEEIFSYNNILFLCDSPYIQYKFELYTHFQFHFFILPTVMYQDEVLCTINRPKCNERFSIVSIGPLDTSRSYSVVLRALKQRVFDKGITNFFYTIIGAGPLESNIKKIIKRYNLENHVAIASDLEVDQKDVLEKAHIFIEPLKQLRNGKEFQISLQLKYALASGCVVIASRHGAIDEYIENGTNGLLFPENDWIHCGRCIRSLIMYSEKFFSMALESRYRLDQNYSEIVFQKCFKKFLYSLSC